MPHVYEVHTWSDSTTGTGYATTLPTRRAAHDYVGEMLDRYDKDPSGWGRIDRDPRPDFEVRAVEVPEVRVCVFCDRFVVTHENPEVDFCRGCYYGGSSLARTHEDLLRDLNALDGITASPWHTGGGCWVLHIGPEDMQHDDDGMELSPFITAVEAYRDEATGEWTGGDPTLPETGAGPWCAYMFPNGQVWAGYVECDWDTLPMVCPANADELVRFVSDNLVGKDA